MEFVVLVPRSLLALDSCYFLLFRYFILLPVLNYYFKLVLEPGVSEYPQLASL